MTRVAVRVTPGGAPHFTRISSVHGQDGQVDLVERVVAGLDGEAEGITSRDRLERRELLLVRPEYPHAAMPTHAAGGRLRDA